MANRSIRAAVLILAAGSSSRFGSDKQFARISGREVIALTVENFLKTREIKKVIIAFSASNIARGKRLFSGRGIDAVQGGDTRMQSLRKAFSALDGEFDVICVHDGARPFVSAPLISELIRTAWTKKAAVPVVPLKDTVKKIRGGRVFSTIDRKTHFAVQTPQCYKADIFKKMISSPKAKKDLTDDSQLLEESGIKPAAVTGDYINFKVTTPEDMALAEVLYEKKLKKSRKKSSAGL
ncbi:MAG: 2-C-methyl-D-erythritol 4-phosphate cytidylyltransferase [Elusimicrobiota bacterium]